MTNLELALGSFWQLARHWKMRDTAKLELSCEGGNLQMNFSAKLGHPDLQHFRQEKLPSFSVPPPPSCKRKTPSQLRRQDRRRVAALDKAATVQAALDKATADKAVADKAVADKAAAYKAAADKALAEKTKAEKAKAEQAKANTAAKIAVTMAAAEKAAATQAVKPSVLRFAAKQDTVAERAGAEKADRDYSFRVGDNVVVVTYGECTDEED